MNYSQAIHYLHSFTDLEKLAQWPKNSFFNLKRMEHLLRAANHPENNFFPVLIAGTTGKGSTGFFLESILKANGIRAGYYHSPHVEDVRERIRVQGKWAIKKEWAEGLSEIRQRLRRFPLPKHCGILTYFEILTLLAIWIFSKKRVQVGIFEIGLGGRLDATNILQAPLVILTPIHLDHEAMLGNTVTKIAAEKAAILKPHGHMVIGKQNPEAIRVLKAAVRKNKGNLWRAKPASGPLGLSGNFQKWNAGVALKTAEVLKKFFHFPLETQPSRQGLLRDDWKGRMETVHRGGRRFILDGAHNPISIQVLVQSLKNEKAVFRRKPLWLIFGAMLDKNSAGMLKILSRIFSHVILTGMSMKRAKPVSMLMQEAKGLFHGMFAALHVPEALSLARQASEPNDTIVVTGSFYLVGEARKILKRKSATLKAQRKSIVAR